MMIFKKAIPRRAFLRGAGATLALPLLEGMIPAFASAPDTVTKPATRLSFVYFPNGVALMENWLPKAEGAAFELPPILEPLAAFKDQMLVLSGLDNNAVWSLQGESSAPHPRASTAFLTGIHIRSGIAGEKTRAGVSADQIVAREFGKHTQLASLELGMESSGVLGACDGGCSYGSTISWRDATTPLPMENHPRAVFERLFGDSDTTDRAERLAETQMRRSILDVMTQDVARLLRGIGPGDRDKVSQYLEAVRDVERRIQMAEEQSSRELPTVQRPAGIPATIEEHLKLLFDLQVLAFQCDLTRVISFMVGHESSTIAYLELGIADPHHPLTHHQGNPESIAKALKINIFHSRMFAYLLEKLRSTSDGDGSLLDHSMIVYGGGLSDGNLHLPTDLPILLMGGGSGQLKGSRHLTYPKGTPLMNLYLTLADKLGIPLEKLGDSTGKINLLSV
ncbi:MAG: DUF1552 domain-containing protein [Acidobacteria bacterium]|nr:DUF1552 domain-containing protein [Acidobacteriota bacterium]